MCKRREIFYRAKQHQIQISKSKKIKEKENTLIYHKRELEQKIDFLSNLKNERGEPIYKRVGDNFEFIQYYDRIKFDFFYNDNY